jgi:hypothetical protein
MERLRPCRAIKGQSVTDLVRKREYTVLESQVRLRVVS